MRKGQSFETMMLVISVIVAVAILGILLNIIRIMPDVGVEANVVIPQLVQKVHSKGYGLEISKDPAKFSQGNRFYRRDALGSAPIAEENVKFVCVESICGSGNDKPLTITDASIIVNRDITGTVAVCVGNDMQYKILVGQVSSKVSQAAEQECKLT